MKNFQSKVAVVTGGASGIGRALAERSATLGMKIVLADIEEQALRQAEKELKASGAEVIAQRTDVSQAGDVEALANLAFTTYGVVHLLFNNAGVSVEPVENTVWGSPLADWQWVLGVNLWGVIYGIHFFVPRMLAQGSEGYIVNTASGAGLLAHAGQASYNVSKHGVVALSETLALELAVHKASLKAAVLCPGWVNTRITGAGRNRPQALQNAREQNQVGSEVQSRIQTLRQLLQAGMPPSQVAEIVFDAIRQDKFYILTDPNIKRGVQLRMDDILHERSPRDARTLARQQILQADE
ncbi:MAG TPA: SDR family NAD(P)-dependent oxidoreductase [Ktedonobacteraceae bacterium]